jgi:Zn-dependent protease
MVSIFWALFNLVPILPLDGGHVLNGILGPNNQRITYTVSFALAALLAASMLFYTGSLWNTVFFGMLAYENFQRLQGNQTSSYFRPN